MRKEKKRLTRQDSCNETWSLPLRFGPVSSEDNGWKWRTSKKKEGSYEVNGGSREDPTVVKGGRPYRRRKVSRQEKVKNGTNT